MTTATVTNRVRLSPQAIHAILSAEVSRQSLPQCYQRDLTVHDLNDLAGVVQFCDSRQLYYIFRRGTLTPCTAEEARSCAAAAARSRHISRPNKEASWPRQNQS